MVSEADKSLVMVVVHGHSIAGVPNAELFLALFLAEKKQMGNIRRLVLEQLEAPHPFMDGFNGKSLARNHGF